MSIHKRARGELEYKLAIHLLVEAEIKAVECFAGVGSENSGRIPSGNNGRSSSEESAMSASDAKRRQKRGKDVRDAEKT